jgi:REP element-mobilizing transposase RayT
VSVFPAPISARNRTLTHETSKGNTVIDKSMAWKEQTFWSDGYFTCSIGNASKNTILKYIQNQG